MWWFRDKYRSIQMLLKFFKVIWNFRGWDYSYNLEIIKKSLEITIESNKNAKVTHIGQDDSIKQMERAVELLNNIIDDNYAEKFGYIYSNNALIFNKIEGSDKYSVDFNIPKDIEEHNRNAIKLGDEQYEKEWAELFTLLKNHLREWWW